MANCLGIDRMHIAPAAKDGIDLACHQPQFGSAPKRFRHGLVVAQPHTPPEQAPAGAVVLACGEHGGEEIVFVQKQVSASLG